MTSKSNVLSWAALVIALVAGAGCVYVKTTLPKIAYIRSLELIQGYKGTIEAKAKFQAKKDEMIVNVDSMKADYMRSQARLAERISSLSPAERKRQSTALEGQRQQVLEYDAAISQRIKADETTMMEGVLNQINSFVDEYGEINGYDVIMGTNSDGNLLYGNKTLDVTEEVLNGVNARYSGKTNVQPE